MNNDPTQPPHQDTPPNLPISHEKGAGAKATAQEQRAPNDQAESQKLDKAEKAAGANSPTQADRGDRPPAGT